MRIAGLLCQAIVVLSLISCVAMAAVRSVGLTHVTVTALNAEAEPQDAGIPFVKQKDRLPDYRLTVKRSDKTKVDLGAKLNMSGVEG